MSLNSWEEDVIGLVEQKHGKKKVSVSFECETLKAEKAAEDHIKQFMPKLAGLDAVSTYNQQFLLVPFHYCFVGSTHTLICGFCS